MGSLSVENRAAIRTAVASLIAILLAFAFHLEKPYWSGMSVVIVANVYAGNIVDKAFMRILGTIIGAILGYFVARFVANSFFLYLLVSFFIVTLAVYYHTFSRFGYAYILGALSAFIVIADIPINANHAFFIAVWRPVEIGLGVLVASVCAFVLLPNFVHDKVKTEVNALFLEARHLINNLHQLLRYEKPYSVQEYQQDLLNFRTKIVKSYDELKVMSRELGVNAKDLHLFSSLLDALYALFHSIYYYVSTHDLAAQRLFLKANKLSPQLFFEATLLDLQELEQHFLTQTHESFGSKTHESCRAIEQKMSEQFNEYLAVYRMHGLIWMHFIRQLARVLGVRPMLNQLTFISYTAQLRRQPEVIVHSLKAGLTAVVALLFWLLSNWPGGLSGIVSSIVIAMRRNFHEMKNIGTYRLIGCGIGGVATLFLMGFWEINLYVFALAILYLVWLFSYFSFHYTRYNYLGLQASVALIMTLAQEGGPPTSIRAPLERLSGIIIGIVASFIVANLIWRTDLVSVLKRQITRIKLMLHHNACCYFAKDPTPKYFDVAPALRYCDELLETLAETQNLPKVHQALQTTLIALQRFDSILLTMQQTVHVNAAKITIKQLSLPDPAAFSAEMENLFQQILHAPNVANLTLYELENVFAYVYNLKQLDQIRFTL